MSGAIIALGGVLLLIAMLPSSPGGTPEKKKNEDSPQPQTNKKNEEPTHTQEHKAFCDAEKLRIDSLPPFENKFSLNLIDGQAPPSGYIGAVYEADCKDAVNWSKLFDDFGQSYVDETSTCKPFLKMSKLQAQLAIHSDNKMSVYADATINANPTSQKKVGVLINVLMYTVTNLGEVNI